MLSIIIVSHNTQDHLKRCLESILVQTQAIDFEIIVVDNASTDHSVFITNQVKKKKAPSNPHCQRITVIKNTQNLGFGVANNQGVVKSRGDWILLLNSDTQLINHTINKLYKYLTKHSKTQNQTILAPQLLNPDHTIQPSGGFFPTFARVFSLMLFLDDLPVIKNFLKPYQQTNLEIYTQDQTFDWLTGACLLMSKKLFQKVNGFDESIFMYGEEIDLQYRLKHMQIELHRRLQVIMTPTAQLIHHKGASSENGFQAAILGEFQGLQKFYAKHYPQLQTPLKYTLVVGALLRFLIFGIIDPQKSTAYGQALKQLYQGKN